MHDQRFREKWIRGFSEGGVRREEAECKRAGSAKGFNFARKDLAMHHAGREVGHAKLGNREDFGEITSKGKKRKSKRRVVINGVVVERSSMGIVRRISHGNG